MVNQSLSHSMPKSAGNPALFLTKSSDNGFNKIKGLPKQVLKSPILDSKARGARARPVAVRWLELKDTLEWRERLPLGFGRKSAHARGRSGVVLVVCHLAGRHRLRPR
jgi:hypothetical protein